MTEIKSCEHVIKILVSLCGLIDSKDFFYSRNDHGKLIQNIVFEFMCDDFEAMIQERNKKGTYFVERDIKLYIYQLLKGLEYIHSKGKILAIFNFFDFQEFLGVFGGLIGLNRFSYTSWLTFYLGIVHRDLKPENILISNKNIVKICDFGSSKHIDLNGKNTPYIVSRYYRAPELNLCITNYNSAIDIWATGCILCELITKEPVFQGTDEGNQLFAIFKVLGSPTKEEFEILSKRVPYDPKIFNDFPSFKKDDKRLRSKFHIMNDKDNLMDLLSKMFAYIPERRINAADALTHPFFDDIRNDYYNLMLKTK